MSKLISEKKIKLVNNYINSILNNESFPAFSISLVENTEIVFSKGFGNLSINDNKLVNEKTLFLSCSTFKPFTGTLIMKLSELGLLDLNDKVKNYLPWLKYPDNRNIENLTIRNLLTHSSGLSSDEEDWIRNEENALENHVRNDIPNKCNSISDPDNVFCYSNPGINILGLIAEIVCNNKFTNIIKTHIFDPLDIRDFSFDLDKNFKNNTAIPHNFDNEGKPFPISFINNKSSYPSAGGLINVLDLSKFAMLHINKGKYLNRKILNSESIEEMHKTHIDAFTSIPRYYGLTFDIEEYKGIKLITHGGSIQGFGSQFVLIPEFNISICMLFNGFKGFYISLYKIIDFIINTTKFKETSNKFQINNYNQYKGTYKNNNKTVSINILDNKLFFQDNNKEYELIPIDKYVFKTDKDNITIGFVTKKDKFTDYLMVNYYPIGLVSVEPYKKVINL